MKAASVITPEIMSQAIPLVVGGNAITAVARSLGVLGDSLWSAIERQCPEVLKAARAARGALVARAIQLVEGGQSVPDAARAVGLKYPALWAAVARKRPDLLGRAAREPRPPKAPRPPRTPRAPRLPRTPKPPREPRDLRPRRRPRPVNVTLEGGRGIDVGACYEDIRRIVLKHFKVPGVHPDDLAQEVIARLIEQNALPCAFDPARASFSRYVFLVASNVSARLANREKRQDEIETAAREEEGSQGTRYVMHEHETRAFGDLVRAADSHA